MPQAIPAFLVSIGASAGAAAVVGAIVVGAAKIFAFGLLNKALSRKPGQNGVPINVTIRSTIAPRRLLFGKVRAAGAIVFVRTSGANNKYLWYVVAYAGHQCQAAYQCWLDKLYIPSADINAGTGAVSTASLDGKLKIWTYLGTGAQTADPNLDTDFTVWTSNHRLRGITYDVLRMERSDKAWPTGAPQMCNRVIEGARVYDPRLDTTNGGSGSHRRDNPSTWAYSNNWALIVRHYLSGGSVVNDQATRLIMYGLKESDSRIDDAYTIAAANIADQSVSGASAPPSGAQVRYTCNLEASCDQPRRDILEDILVCAVGELVYLHGKWRIFAAAYDAPAHTFTQNALIDDIESEDTTPEEERFNQICAVYIDEEKEWTQQTTPVRSNAAYVTQDGGREKLRTVVLTGVTNQYRAQRIIELMLRKARQMRVVRLPLDRSGLAVAPYETISFDHVRYNWVARIFRCMEREPTFNETGGMGCLITAKAEISTIYTDPLTADYTTGTSVTNTVQSETPDEPTALVAISQIAAIEFTWSLGDFWQRNGTVELWEYTANTPFASATKIWEGKGTRVVITKQDSTPRYYWIRLATIAGQVSATEPSGNGLLGVARPYRDAIPDPLFELATDQTYWKFYSDFAGAAATGVSISPTGGVSGGRLIVVCDGATKYIMSNRTPALRPITRQKFALVVRWRRRGAIAGAGNLIVVRGYATNSATMPPSGTLQAPNNPIIIDNTTIAAATVDEWQEHRNDLEVLNVSKSSPQLAYFFFIIEISNSATSGTLEFDSVDASPI